MQDNESNPGSNHKPGNKCLDSNFENRTPHHLLPKLDLNITNRCNLRCKHCAFDSGIISLKEVSLEKLTDLLVQTKRLGGKKIDVTGGDPTVRRDFLEIVKAAKDLEYKVELVTNSLLLGPEKLQMLKSMGLDGIAISLDGYRWETHQNIRGISRDQYAQVLANLSTAAKLGLATKINTTVFESNYREIPLILQRGADLGAKEVGLYYFTPVGRGARQMEQSVEPQKWLEFIRQELFPYRNLVKVSLELPLIEREKYRKGMGCIWEVDPYHLQILPDGKVYPCAIMASYGKPIGDLQELPVHEIWENQEIWQKYHLLLKEIFQEKGSCVDFKSFDIRNYPGYTFVCPLRKFSLEDMGEMEIGEMRENGK